MEHNDKKKLLCVFNFENSGQPITRYVTGFTGSISVYIERPQGGVLCVPSMYLVQARTEVKNQYIAIVEICADFTYKDAYRTYFDLHNQYQTDSSVSAGIFFLLQREYAITIDLHNDLFVLMRRKKTTDEIVCILRAREIAHDAWQIIRKEIVIGAKEEEIAWKIEQIIRSCGAEDVSFDPIVASGPQSALPHAKPTTRTICSTDAIVVDFGARFQGYCSDVTYTMLMPDVSELLHTAYRSVEAAYARVLIEAKAGVATQELDSAARLYTQFPHALGHGVGMEVHELPRISKTSTDILENGDVIALEPAWYQEGIGGIRIEDTIVIS